PGFWGIEFPKSAPVMPSQIANGAGEDQSGDAVKRAAPPDLQEVDRLKKEVSELQTQLKTLTGNSSNAESPAPGEAESAASATGWARQQQEERVLEQLFAQEAKQDQVQGPKRLVAYPKKRTSSVVRAASKIATAGALAAVVVAAAIAAYRFGLFDPFLAKATAAKQAPDHALGNKNSVAPPAGKTGDGSSGPATSNSTVPVTTPPAAANLVSKTGSETGFAAAAVDSVHADTAIVKGSRPTSTTPKEPKRRNGLEAGSSASRV